MYNVTMLATTSWEELLSAVKKVIPEIIPATERLEKLEQSRDLGRPVLDQNPGVKLLGVYKQTFHNAKAVQIES